jgi:hypothetical protein
LDQSALLVAHLLGNKGLRHNEFVELLELLNEEMESGSAGFAYSTG